MATFAEAQAEAMASAPLDRVWFDTMEIYHPSFLSPDGNTPVAARFVKQYFPCRAKIEAGYAIDGGEVVRFEPLMFTWTWPNASSGELPTINIAMDNVDNVMTKWADLAGRSPDETRVIYRPYLFYPSTDLIDGDVRVCGVSDAAARSPGMDPVLRMTVSNIELSASSFSFTATPIDLVNVKFPREVATKARFPTLNQ